MDVYAAREDPVPGVTGALVAAAVPLPPAQVVFEPSWSAVAGHLAERARPGDVVITCGAGDVTMIGPEVLARLAGVPREAGRGTVSNGLATELQPRLAARGRARRRTRLADHPDGRRAARRWWASAGLAAARHVRPRRRATVAGHRHRPAGPGERPRDRRRPRRRRRWPGWTPARSPPGCERLPVVRSVEVRRQWPRTRGDRGARAGARRRAAARRDVRARRPRAASRSTRSTGGRAGCRWSAPRSTPARPRCARRSTSSTRCPRPCAARSAQVRAASRRRRRRLQLTEDRTVVWGERRAAARARPRCSPCCSPAGPASTT